MHHMLSWFDLKEGHRIEDFQRDYQELVERLREKDLVVSTGPLGERDSNSCLDTDNERNQRFFAILSFRDKEQSEAAYEEIMGNSGPSIAPHNAIINGVENPVFLFWEDLSI